MQRQLTHACGRSCRLTSYTFDSPSGTDVPVKVRIGPRGSLSDTEYPDPPQPLREFGVNIGVLSEFAGVCHCSGQGGETHERHLQLRSRLVKIDSTKESHQREIMTKPGIAPIEVLSLAIPYPSPQNDMSLCKIAGASSHALKV